MATNGNQNRKAGIGSDGVYRTTLFGGAAQRSEQSGGTALLSDEPTPIATVPTRVPPHSKFAQARTLEQVNEIYAEMTSDEVLPSDPAERERVYGEHYRFARMRQEELKAHERNLRHSFDAY